MSLYWQKSWNSTKGGLEVFKVLGPGRPLAGGPRMDRRAVTSSGRLIFNFYTLWIQKRHMTHRLPGMTLWSKNVTWLTGCQEWLSDPKTLHDSQAARHDTLIQKRYVTHWLPGMTLWSKNFMWLTGCQEWHSDPKMLRDSLAARNDPLIQKRYVTHRLPGMTLWSKNIT